MHSHPDEARGGLSASVSHFYHPYFCRLGGRTTTTLGALLVNPRYSTGADEEEALNAESGQAHSDAGRQPARAHEGKMQSAQSETNTAETTGNETGRGHRLGHTQSALPGLALMASSSSNRGTRIAWAAIAFVLCVGTTAFVAATRRRRSS